MRSDVVALYERPGMIRHFFREIWNIKDEPHVYCVFLAQKCLNINEIYFREWGALLRSFSNTGEADTLEIKYRTRFLSQSAWIIKAEEFVSYYDAHFAFPRTYLVDEFMLSGHDIGNAVFGMLKAISFEYGKKHPLTESTVAELKKAFFASLDIRIYVRDSRSILLESDITKRISWQKNYVIEDWWIYVNNVAERITKDENVENTAFMPTFSLTLDGYSKLRNYMAHENGWHGEIWRYEDVPVEIWNNIPLKDNNQAKMTESLCVHSLKGKQQYHITPYISFGIIDQMDLAVLIDNLLQVFMRSSSKQFQQFVYVLARSNQWALDIKLHLCMSILSVLRMTRLIRAAGIKQSALLGNDFDKVSMNFGTVSETKMAFEALMEDSKPAEALREQLSSVIIAFLTRYAQAIPYSDNMSCDANATQGYCLKRAEDYFIDLDFKEEAQRQHRREKNIIYVSWSKFDNKECSLSNYFEFFHAQNLKTSFYQQLSAMLLLVYNGVIGYRALNTDGDSAFLKVGEITSLVAVKRRLFNYLPALMDLEEICTKHGYAFESWAGLYGRYLDRHPDETENTVNMNLGWEFQYYANRFEKVKRSFCDFAPLCKEINSQKGLPNAFSEEQEKQRRILCKLLRNLL